LLAPSFQALLSFKHYWIVRYATLFTAFLSSVCHQRYISDSAFDC
jgi:hypothetical protein